MNLDIDSHALEAIHALAVPLSGRQDEHDALLHLIGDARFVLLGEASHGTHDFYQERARITRRLLSEKGFHAVAIEADWPDAYRVNRFVKGRSDDRDASEALGDFKRFPTWMWRNTEMRDFLDWLRGFNDCRPEEARIGLYGMDLYSLHGSMEAVLQYLDQADPNAARVARDRYACFNRFGIDSQVYGFMTGSGAAPSCERGVVQILADLRRRAAETVRAGGSSAEEDAVLNATQNAHLVKNAEAYYRSMYLDSASSWNLRDEHMTETLDGLTQYLDRRFGAAKIVVWAHNSHLGDARATEMGQHHGELNVGQLMRERHGDDAVLVGFTTHTGSVTAATEWGQPGQRQRVVPSLPGSHEALLHASGLGRFLLPLRPIGAMHRRRLGIERLERAIGVLYRPETERQSHYFHACLPAQFDAVIHLDQTRALRPLDPGSGWAAAGELPDTFPSGI